MGNYKVPNIDTFLWQMSVIDKDLTSPPAASKGDRYLVYGTGSGAWAGLDGKIVIYTGSGWESVSSVAGMVVYVVDEDKYYVYDGADWEEYLLKSGVRNSSKSFIISNPTADSDSPVWRVPSNITITAIHLLCKGAVIVGNLWEYDSNGLNGSSVDSSDITGIVDTNVNDDGSLTNPNISAGNYLGWASTSVSVGATRAIITFDYTIN
jgi:hypothetical protein